MPNKLRNLSGKEIVKFLERNTFVVHKIRGSHCKMRRIYLDNIQTLMIPLHDSVAKGTLRDIYNQVLEYIPGPKTKNFFFTE